MCCSTGTGDHSRSSNPVPPSTNPPYAKSPGAPFIFPDQRRADLLLGLYQRPRAPRQLVLFPTRSRTAGSPPGDQTPLATTKIPEFYLRRQGEQWQVRPYQRECMQELNQAVALGKRRFLIELPTGTGKTDLICLYLQVSAPNYDRPVRGVHQRLVRCRHRQRVPRTEHLSVLSLQRQSAGFCLLDTNVRDRHHGLFGRRCRRGRRAL